MKEYITINCDQCNHEFDLETTGSLTKEIEIKCPKCDKTHKVKPKSIEWTTAIFKDRMIHQFGHRVSVVYNLSTTHISVIKDGTVIRTTEGITDVREYQKFLEGVAIDAFTLQSFDKEDNEEKQ